MMLLFYKKKSNGKMYFHSVNNILDLSKSRLNVDDIYISVF